MPIGCGDPTLALGIVDAHPDIDLIISDVLMPGQTGPELVASILARAPRIRALFVTGFAGEAGSDLEFGGHQVLRKPFSINALDQAIAITMDAHPAAGGMASQAA